MTALRTVNHAGILRYLIQFKTDNNGDSPTYEEIMAACKISSKSVVGYHLRALQDEGLITLPDRYERRRIGVTGGRCVYEGEQ